jgi:hypothetical protein
MLNRKVRPVGRASEESEAKPKAVRLKAASLLLSPSQDDIDAETELYLVISLAQSSRQVQPH